MRPIIPFTSLRKPRLQFLYVSVYSAKISSLSFWTAHRKPTDKARSFWSPTTFRSVVQIVQHGSSSRISDLFLLRKFRARGGTRNVKRNLRRRFVLPAILFPFVPRGSLKYKYSIHGVYNTISDASGRHLKTTPTAGERRHKQRSPLSFPTGK